MRTTTSNPEALLERLKLKSEVANKWHSYPCKLVTPMYGGGVKAGIVDTEMPIRATEIRGQLRFWWRIACCELQLPSQEMFRRESAIFGSIGTEIPVSSKIEVRVKNVFNPVLEAAFEYQRDTREGKQGKFRTSPDAARWADGYALFSAQGELGEGNSKIVKAPNTLAIPSMDSISDFILEIRLDEALSDQQKNEINMALRWWSSFGGLGARTRRGLGAILVMGVAPVTPAEVIEKKGVIKFIMTPGNPIDSWKKSIIKLKDFRQTKGVGRNPSASDSQSPAGRSLWPEADALRMLSGRSDVKHSKRLVEGDIFPRAAFGLPIVFHFKDKSDPDDHILEPANSRDNKRERMASPLILRPYWDGEVWKPAALLLPGWEKALTQPLKFKGQNYQPAHWPTNIDEGKTLAAKIRPMKNGDHIRAADPLSAFMNFFEKGPQ